MKTLDLTAYLQDPSDLQSAPYPVRDTLMNVLFVVPNLKARELLARDDLARKIRDFAGAPDTFELEEAEALQLVTAFEAAQGFTRNDVELVRRVLALAPDRT